MTGITAGQARYAANTIAGKSGAPSIWTDDQTGMLCEMVANGRSFVDAAKCLPFDRRQCSDRFKTIRRGYGWQAA